VSRQTTEQCAQRAPNRFFVPAADNSPSRPSPFRLFCPTTLLAPLPLAEAHASASPILSRFHGEPGRDEIKVCQISMASLGRLGRRTSKLGRPAMAVLARLGCVHPLRLHERAVVFGPPLLVPFSPAGPIFKVGEVSIRRPAELGAVSRFGAKLVLPFSPADQDRALSEATRPLPRNLASNSAGGRSCFRRPPFLAYSASHCKSRGRPWARLARAAECE